jgi:tellurite methyltransferase
MKKNLNFYENLYNRLKKTKYTFGLPQKELIKFMNSARWKKARILDLGCGDGRNIIFLALKNLAVWGIDNSVSGLRKIKEKNKNNPLIQNIHLKQADLKTIKLKQRNYFDLVICVYTFHEIGLNGVKNIIKQAKLSTKPHGINYLAIFIPQKGTFIRKECYYPNENDIIKIQELEDYKEKESLFDAQPSHSLFKKKRNKA